MSAARPFTRRTAASRPTVPTIGRLAALAVLAMLAVVALVAPLREWLEVSMARQMLVLLPWVFAAGCLSPRLLPLRGRGRLARASRPYALTLLVVATVAYGAWMLPIALDLSRISPWINVAKYITVLLAGLSTGVALRVSAWPIVLFFGGNVVWMGLTFGMLFLDAESRLCASYLIDDQRMAGVGLMVYAMVLGVWLLVWAARRADRADSAKELAATAVNAGEMGSQEQ
ncbi:hypothetical protein [Cupriavidus sp. RAF12]|uniref:hypothetical protein n=1 Tax=Cupriavidus sp. RAF12 TaxID=3233050 RepID=UPI003F910EA6